MSERVSEADLQLIEEWARAIGVRLAEAEAERDRYERESQAWHRAMTAADRQMQALEGEVRRAVAVLDGPTHPPREHRAECGACDALEILRAAISPPANTAPPRPKPQESGARRPP
jgi:hypothetical protein